MGRLGFAGPKRERRGSCRECGNPEILVPELAELTGLEDDDEAGMLGLGPRRPRPNDTAAKTYMLYFTSTMAILCFCIFFIAPQLIDYFTSAKALEMESKTYVSEESALELLPSASRSARNQERLDVMRKFDALQQKYKELQVQYKQAEEAYLEKLHSAIEQDNGDGSLVNGNAEPSKIEIYKLEEADGLAGNASVDEKARKKVLE